MLHDNFNDRGPKQAGLSVPNLLVDYGRRTTFYKANQNINAARVICISVTVLLWLGSLIHTFAYRNTTSPLLFRSRLGMIGCYSLSDRLKYLTSQPCGGLSAWVVHGMI